MTRVFLDWDGSPPKKVAQYLIPEITKNAVDFSDTLIIVPTRQARRRLQIALAKRAPLLSLRIEVPSFFINPSSTFTNIATPTETLAAWHRVIMEGKLEAYPALFPNIKGIGHQSIGRSAQSQDTWVLETAEMIQNLRRTLVDGGLRISDVAKRKLQESERWDDLARLETKYIERMKEIKRYDAYTHMLKQANHPIPPNCSRIVLAAVPDPSPLVLNALTHLAKEIPIEILVHAPEHMQDYFDEWGRPLSEVWKKFTIKYPINGLFLRLVKDPHAQAKIIHEELKDETALGVMDSEVGQMLSSRIPTFNPAGKPILTHPVYQLISLLIALVEDASYKNVSACLRHADLLDYLGVDLKKVDRYQNKHLPQDLSAMHISDLDGLRDILAQLKRKPLKTMRALLEQIYAKRIVDPGTAEGEAFIKVTEKVRGVLDELEGLEGPVLTLLKHQLAKASYVVRVEEGCVDLEGWLELPWKDASFLILAGMNDRLNPGDSFLPQNVRKMLGMRDDEDRYARDVYMLASMLAWREKTLMLVGKYSAKGDPLLPSRLLFQCASEDIARHAKILFADPPEIDIDPPFSYPFKLTVPGPSEFPVPEHIRVTMFKDFLCCPFRFYLKHIMGMEAQDDLKEEMDALDFGTGMHFALEGLGENEDIVVERMQEWVCDRYGKKRPLNVDIQLDNACQRLRAAVRVHAKEVHAGWQMLEVEKEFKKEINGMMVRGKIDRIDRHEKTGAIRILDYKTYEKFSSMEKIHFQTQQYHLRDYTLVNEKKSWLDLQLPLYCLGLDEKDIEIGFFVLPKAINDTAIVMWETFNDALLQSAVVCARGIIDDIRGGNFWPPAERLPYDDFERLFFTRMDEAVEFDSKS